MKVLNLYAGIGGNRKFWKDVKVTAVEYNNSIANVYQDMYPNDTVVVGDAVDYLLKNYREYDFIWASPPCPSHSKIRFVASKRGSYTPILPDLTLYSIILFLQKFADKQKWCVENVQPYYTPLVEPTIKLGRHLFWSNFGIAPVDIDTLKHNDIRRRAKEWGLDLSKYKIDQRKDQVIRNCVHPKLGEHILKEAYGQGHIKERDKQRGNVYGGEDTRLFQRSTTP